MPDCWRYAWLFYNPQTLRGLDVDLLPVSVCGLLARMLPDAPDAVPLRSDIAKRLRAILTTEWMQRADLGELAAALDGLQACAPQHIGGQDVIRFAKRLLAAEVTAGGPYCRPGGEVDPLTNAFIAQCLEWMAAPLPNVSAYLHSAVADAGSVASDDIAFLAAIQKPAIWLERHIDILVTALCWRIVYAGKPCSDGVSPGQMLVRRIHDNCIRKLPDFAEPFKSNTHAMLRQVLQADSSHEISLLAWYFGQALSGGAKPPFQNDRQLYENLGMANVYAWAAYTIYDDFLDDEGRPQLLGTANYSFRAMIRHYREVLPGNDPFQQFVEQALTAVDQANSLETTMYRLASSPSGITIGGAGLPDFHNRDMLADRALFHIIGPMAVLAANGRASAGDELWHNTLLAMKHYLIAKQLNDDIHDWVKDLQAGQATYVVVSLLRYLNLTPGHYGFRQLLPYARRQFWQHVLPQVCETALAHIAASRHHLRGLTLPAGSEFVGLFDHVENSMYAALEKRRQSQQLLQSFGGEAADQSSA